jgi:hypothetical protein
MVGTLYVEEVLRLAKGRNGDPHLPPVEVLYTKQVYTFGGRWGV